MYFKEALLGSTLAANLSHKELLSRAKFLVKDLKIKPQQHNIEQSLKKSHFMTAGYLLNHVPNLDKVIKI